MSADYAFLSVGDGEKRAAYAAHLLETWIATVLREREHCVLCLSGGSTPKPVYERLAAADTVEWGRLRLCLADERCVPSADDASNAKLIHATLGRKIEAAHIVAPNTGLAPQACSDDYEERVMKLLGKNAVDIAVLGMGDDGHIASLFPPVPNEALQRMGAVHTVTRRFAVHDRVSLTLPLLARAHKRLLLLSGKEKRNAWEACVAATHDEKRWPLHALLDARLTVLADWQP